MKRTSPKRQIMDIIEVDHVEDTKSEGHWGRTSLEALNVGTIPAFEIHNVGIVPTFKMHNVGTVPTFKMHNFGTVPTYNKNDTVAWGSVHTDYFVEHISNPQMTLSI